MKNIFKFMGIALMACSLTMVSCSKDENETKSGVTVKFADNASWNSENIYWEQMYYQSGEEAPLYDWEVEGATDADPMTWGMTGNEAGTFVGNWQAQDLSRYYVWYYVNNDDDYYEYPDPQTGETHYYAMNQGYTATTTISALDVTATTVSMKVDAKTFDCASYIESQGTDMITSNLAIEANNVKWTEMTK